MQLQRFWKVLCGVFTDLQQRAIFFVSISFYCRGGWGGVCVKFLILLPSKSSNVLSWLPEILTVRAEK